nr:NADH dehydrogenase subunit 2 [Orientocreadium sp. HS]
MRGVFLFFFSFSGLLIFTSLLFSANNIFLFWLFLELSTLCLVPMYFCSLEFNGLSSLFNYLIVSSISSSLIVSGVLFESFVVLIVLGLLVKFGLFPFLGWAYNVILGSNWAVVWGFSTLLKTSFFLIPFFLLGVGSKIAGVSVAFSFLTLSLFFWFYTYSWRGCWAHMMLSSSSCLVAISYNQSLEVLVLFFIVYLVWSSSCILLLYTQESLLLTGVGSTFLFCFLFLSLPVSFSIFYKFVLSCCMFSCGLGVFLVWVFYSLSEQFYLLKFLVDTSLPRSGLGVLGLV